MRLRWEQAPVPFQVVYSPPPLLFSFFSASWGTTRHHFLRAHAHKSKYPPSPPPLPHLLACTSLTSQKRHLCPRPRLASPRRHPHDRERRRSRYFAGRGWMGALEAEGPLRIAMQLAQWSADKRGAPLWLVRRFFSLLFDSPKHIKRGFDCLTNPESF